MPLIHTALYAILRTMWGFTECESLCGRESRAPSVYYVLVAPVAQGIEHFSPKEGVVRSIRIRGTQSESLTFQHFRTILFCLLSFFAPSETLRSILAFPLFSPHLSTVGGFERWSVVEMAHAYQLCLIS